MTPTDDQVQSPAAFYVHQDILVSEAEKSDPDKVWKSTENFSIYKQKEATHQIITCARSGEVIFCIPAKFHQQDIIPPALEEKVKTTLVKSLNFKRSQVKRLSKRRKVEAKKWVFWGKCYCKNILSENKK